jgi:ubiquinone/menaquinone biosynthesis C-methylase UbiE
MKPDTLQLLQDPQSADPLNFDYDLESSRYALLNPKTGKRFLIQNGIPDFTSSDFINGKNQKYQTLYNRMAPLYDFSTTLYAKIKCGGDRERVMSYLKELEIKEGDRVLETSIGTGRNVQYLPPYASYYGIDISQGMLAPCQRMAYRHHLDVDLFLCPAERLCFKDETFDVVYHVGGINYFNDRGAAVREMIRVARPGTKIIIVDETEDLAKKYENVPGASGFYKIREEKISSPIDLVPPEMHEIQINNILGGDLYCLSFRKPV